MGTDVWELGCGIADITGPAAELGLFGMAKDGQARFVDTQNTPTQSFIMYFMHDTMATILQVSKGILMRLYGMPPSQTILYQ